MIGARHDGVRKINNAAACGAVIASRRQLG